MWVIWSLTCDLELDSLVGLAARRACSLLVSSSLSLARRISRSIGVSVDRLGGGGGHGVRSGQVMTAGTTEVIWCTRVRVKYPYASVTVNIHKTGAACLSLVSARYSALRNEPSTMKGCNCQPGRGYAAKRMSRCSGQ